MIDDPDHFRKYGVADKPHIRLVRGYWSVFRDRLSLNPISLTSRFEKLKVVGPWRPCEISCYWYGDAKPS